MNSVLEAPAAPQAETPAAETSGPEKFNRLLRIPKGILKIGTVAVKDVPMFSGIKLSRAADKTMRVEVTDGRRAVVATWEDAYLLPDNVHSAVIPADLAMLADKAVPAKGTPDELMVDVSLSDAHPDFEAKAHSGTDCVTVAGEGLKVEDFPNIEGATPEYTRTSAKTGTAARATLGLELFIGLLKSMHAAGCDQIDLDVPTKTGRPIKVVGKMPEAGIIVTGIQMPLRTPDDVKEDEEPTAYMPGMEPPPPTPEPPKDGTAEMFPAPGDTSLDWKEMSDTQHFAETASGVRKAGSTYVPQFVVTFTDGEWNVDQSSGCLIADRVPGTFETVGAARAWCQRREDELLAASKAAEPEPKASKKSAKK